MIQERTFGQYLGLISSSLLKAGGLYFPPPIPSTMHEITVNLHMHTRYSDGQGSHREIAAAAIRAGVDAVIVTDHNVWVNGPERIYHDGQKRCLLLVGEEIHDASRRPQKNHLLVFGAETELAHLADDPRILVDGVAAAGGICFFAHPTDRANPIFNESDITWEAWDIQGYTGIELWNGLSEFKSLLKSRLHAIYYVLDPRRVPHGPPPELLLKWDELMNAGRRVVAVAGSDAHQLHRSMGPLKRVIFPYEVHFRSINTHLLLPASLIGEVDYDQALIYDALRAGHAFVGNDLPAPTRGFRFSGQSPDGDFVMGDEVSLGSGVTLQIWLPRRAECMMRRNGEVFKTWDDREAMVANVSQPGVYRVEVYLDYLGKRRGWIFSNPVYVR